MNPIESKKNLQEKIIAALDNSLPIKNGFNDAEKAEFDAFQHSGMDFVSLPYVEASTEYKSADVS